MDESKDVAFEVYRGRGAVDFVLLVLILSVGQQSCFRCVARLKHSLMWRKSAPPPITIISFTWDVPLSLTTHERGRITSKSNQETVYLK